jgi:hypothetical protein
MVYTNSQFKYFGMIVTDQNLIQEQIKWRLNSGKACYSSVLNLLSSRLLSKNVKETGVWRKLHNEELYGLYSSRNVIKIIKSKCMKWAGHVARMGEKRNVYSLLKERQRESDHQKDQDVGR